MSNTNDVGQMGAYSANTHFNAVQFAMKQMLGRVSTATLVQIKKVYPAGPDKMGGQVGWIDVLPLVNQTDGAGNVEKHSTVYQLPYFRAQGGTRAIVLDPVVGDIGLAVICSRDISAVKRTKKQSNPGSRRRFSMSDGVYCMSLMGDKPTSRIEFQLDGTINITSDDGTTQITIKNTGEITATPDKGVTLVDIKPGDIKATPDSGVTFVEIKPGDVKATPDSGTTYVEVKPGDVTATPDGGSTKINAIPNKISLLTSSLAVYVQPTRIDLGKINAPHAVMTDGGASQKVFAVIAESGP